MSELYKDWYGEGVVGFYMRALACVGVCVRAWEKAMAAAMCLLVRSRRFFLGFFVLFLLGPWRISEPNVITLPTACGHDSRVHA